MWLRGSRGYLDHACAVFPRPLRGGCGRERVGSVRFVSRAACTETRTSAFGPSNAWLRPTFTGGSTASGADGDRNLPHYPPSLSGRNATHHHTMEKRRRNMSLLASQLSCALLSRRRCFCPRSGSHGASWGSRALRGG